MPTEWWENYDYLLNNSHRHFAVYSPLRIHTPQCLNKYCRSILPASHWSLFCKGLTLPSKASLFPYVYLLLDTITLFLSLLIILSWTQLVMCTSQPVIVPNPFLHMVCHLHLNSSVSFANMVCSKPNLLPFSPPYHNETIFLSMKQMMNLSLLSILLVSSPPSGNHTIPFPTIFVSSSFFTIVTDSISFSHVPLPTTLLSFWMGLSTL